MALSLSLFFGRTNGFLVRLFTDLRDLRALQSSLTAGLTVLELHGRSISLDLFGVIDFPAGWVRHLVIVGTRGQRKRQKHNNQYLQDGHGSNLLLCACKSDTRGALKEPDKS